MTKRDDTILQRFRDFDYNSEMTSDPEWQAYLNYCFAEREMQIIQKSNRGITLFTGNEDQSSTQRPACTGYISKKKKTAINL